MSSPFVRRRRLAAELRTLREQNGITADELARRIYRSRMTVSKLENARCRPDIRDIVKILKVLGVTGERFDAIFKIACDAADRGWWDAYGDAMGARQRMYADLESGAATIREYHQLALPGLLQSVEYHWALIELDRLEGSEMNYVPEKSVEARQCRQQNLFRRNGPSLEVIIDEFLLKRLAVSPLVMAAQLKHMVQLVTREPRFTILVLPLDARLPPGRLPASAYTIYEFPDPDDPRLVVAETSNRLVHTTPDEVKGYDRLHDRLRQAALPSLESLSLLTDTADRLSEQAGP
ncbi:helix-turn-helix domain-containing protein [Actinomadura livida]|uniref:Helix-turn-helix transcriptional regulator n=1 Tax=Actinomadura livida TaxID=79909 RepID=A0A7W7MZN9_9ACTN|nr:MULTISPECIES: helix-turn-helix transcriptional regulator [Actinomadura]MBB4777038.1 transcriptional regulator with XRE-family HTH domain [Actinomadura catellatispora]GGU36862.1 transcriptional regulator [Actinomadura livida]